MPHKGSATAEEKIQIIEEYLSGKIGYTEAYRRAGIGKTTLGRWISRYRTEGPTGFLPQERNRSYSKETKLTAVMDYLGGKCSLGQICEQYQIRNTRQLSNWLEVYNRYEDFKELNGGSRITKHRTTTQDERLEIVKECIADGNNYGAMAIKYEVSYCLLLSRRAASQQVCSPEPEVN